MFPESLMPNVCCRTHEHLYITSSFLVWRCRLEVETMSAEEGASNVVLRELVGRCPGRLLCVETTDMRKELEG